MTYYIIPLFQNKSETKNILSQLERNLTYFVNDDFILGSYPIKEINKFNNFLNEVYSFLKIEKVCSSNQLSFSEQTNCFLKNILNSTLTQNEKRSSILSYFYFFGLTLINSKSKEDEVNKIFFDINYSFSNETNKWLEILTLITDFYNPLTNEPYNNFQFENYFTLTKFLQYKKRFTIEINFQ